MKIYKLYLFIIVLFTQSCSDDNSDWIYLFDGKTTEGWRAYNGDKMPEKWAVVDGELTFDTQLKLEEDWEGGGDIIYYKNNLNTLSYFLNGNYQKEVTVNFL